MHRSLQLYCLRAYLYLDDIFDIRGHFDESLHFDEQYYNMKSIIKPSMSQVMFEKW